VIKNLGQYFLYSFGNDTKIELNVDKMKVSIPLIKDYRNTDIRLEKKFIV